MDIKEYRAMNKPERLAVTQHAKNRISERGICIDDLINAIRSGEIIKEYPDDRPLPSCLVLGQSENGSPMHLVMSKDEEFIYIITAYYPDENQWEKDFKTRKGC